MTHMATRNTTSCARCARGFRWLRALGATVCLALLTPATPGAMLAAEAQQGEAPEEQRAATEAHDSMPAAMAEHGGRETPNAPEPDEGRPALDHDTASPTAVAKITSTAPAPVIGRLQPVSAPLAGVETLLGAEDLIDIRVLGVDELATTTRVSEAGNINFPLIGQVRVAGLSPGQLELTLAQLLETRYINDAQVSVFVKEFGSRMVSVIGAVMKPGRYPMLGRRTLLDMISDAGGLTDDAGPVAIITRRAEGPDAAPRTLEVDLEALLYHGRTDLNHEIASGDLVHVPVDLPVRIYVNGAVGKPGEYETRASRPLTLLQAITKAGGLTARAARKKVEILRRTDDGGQATLPIDLKKVMRGEIPDPVLQDGDVVVVRETYF